MVVVAARRRFVVLTVLLSNAATRGNVGAFARCRCAAAIVQHRGRERRACRRAVVERNRRADAANRVFRHQRRCVCVAASRRNRPLLISLCLIGLLLGWDDSRLGSVQVRTSILSFVPDKSRGFFFAQNATIRCQASPQISVEIQRSSRVKAIAINRYGIVLSDRPSLVRRG